MSRLCERPGCSEPGAAEYGMVPEDLLFWIAPLPTTPHEDHAVLCGRHADAMSVPRGWTLDDRREEIPRLFMPRRPSTSDEPPVTRRRTRARRISPEVEQLEIDGTGEVERPIAPTDASDPAVTEVATPIEDSPVGRTDDDLAGADAERDHGHDGPWTPAFDHDSDLDGLLRVSSPLLARAFRGTDRPRD